MVTRIRHLPVSAPLGRKVLQQRLALGASLVAALFVAACGDDSGTFRREANQIRAPQLVVPSRLTPPIRIENIEGAPPDWKLTERIAEALRNRDIPAGADIKSRAAYVLRGQIKITASSARDDQLSLTWTLFDDKGTKVGDVTQLAAVPKSTAGSKMDDIVDAMADAAAESISPIVPSALLQAKLDTTGEPSKSLPRHDIGPKVTEIGKQAEKADSPLSKNLLAPPQHDAARRPTADLADPATKPAPFDGARYGQTDKDNAIAQNTGRTLSQNLTATPDAAQRTRTPQPDKLDLEPNPRTADPAANRLAVPNSTAPPNSNAQPNSTAQKDTTPKLSLEPRPSATAPDRTPPNLSMQPRSIPDLNATTGIKPVPFTATPSTDDPPPTRTPNQPPRADKPPMPAADPATDTSRFAQRDDRPNAPIVDGDPTRKGATTSGIPPIRNPLVTRNEPPPSAARRDTQLSEDAKPADPPRATPPSRTGFLVQIGAYRDLAEGNAAWRRTQSQAPTLLKEVPYALNQVNIPGKGTWLRLQLGPYDDRAQAERLCSDLKAARVDCFLVRGESQAVVMPAPAKPEIRTPARNQATTDRKPKAPKPAITATPPADPPATPPAATTQTPPTNGTRTATPPADSQPSLSPSRGLPGVD